MSEPTLQQNSGQKRRRGKRGGKKNKPKQHQQKSKTPSNTTRTGGSSKPISATSWSALEKEWFPTDALSDDQQKIPEPFLLSDLIQHDKSLASPTTTSANADHFQQLQKLWWNFSHKKGQRRALNETATSTTWKPRPIQLQSWSILMQPSQNNMNGGKPHNPHQSTINMIGLSPTASGKTLAFGAPMVLAANSAGEKDNGSSNSNSVTVWGIVLLPTRELAQQVAKELELMVSCAPKPKLQKQPTIRVLTCCGGDTQSTYDQINFLQSGGSGCRWLISATPGRLWDIMQKCQNQNSNKAQVVIEPRYLVLDESDRLASNSDLGEQVTSILKTCMAAFPATLAFFSATYPHKVQEQWREWMNLSQRPAAMIRVDAVSMETNNKTPRKKQKVEEEPQSGNDNTISDEAIKNWEHHDSDVGGNKIEEEHNNNTDDEPTSLSTGKNQNDFLSSIPPYLVQTLHVCAEHKKAKKLMNTLDKIRKEEQASNQRQKRLGVIFFGRIKTLIYVSKLLKKQSNHSCLELHSQLPQHLRTGNMHLFQTGKVPILLATDIAARGLHVSNIGFVINYDFPSNLEQYVHRCGRAGRNYQPDEATESKQTTKLPPTVYSFFTRSLAPMAPDLVSLLQASNAWVDPNLLALLNELGKGSDKKKKSKTISKDAENPANSSSHSNTAKGSGDDDDNDEPVLSDDDAFPELSAKRIVLKRASHVSDASSSSSSSDEDD